MVDLATGEQAARHFFSKAGARTARRKTGTVPIFRLESGACPIQMGTVPVFRLSAQQAARLSREVRQHRAVRVRHQADRKSTRLNSSHSCASRMPSSACKKK